MTMTGPGAGTAFGTAYTADDLATMPDDGRRYELIDGMLLVTPSPHGLHQVAVVRLVMALNNAAPEGTMALTAPYDVFLSSDTVLQPDVLVTQRDAIGARLEINPLLAVEVLSPSTRRYDLTLKKARLEAAGCPAYWIVDPEAPRLMAWELRDGAYVEVADVSGDDTFTAETPFPCTIVPAELVA